MGLVFSIANRKGGVGKTTLSIALAETFISQFKMNVVVLDLDPQSSTSEILLPPDKYIRRLEDKRVLANLWDGPQRFARKDVDRILETGLNRLDGLHDVEFALVPNSADLWELEYKILRKRQETRYRRRVNSTLEALKAKFDVVIIDCPPGRLIAADEVISQSDMVLCPVVPRKLSRLGMGQMETYLNGPPSLSKRKPPWRFVWSIYEESNSESKQVIADTQNSTLNKYFLRPEQNADDQAGTLEKIQILNRIDMAKRLSRLSDVPGVAKSFESVYGQNAKDLRRIAIRMQEIGAENNGK